MLDNGTHTETNTHRQTQTNTHRRNCQGHSHIDSMHGNENYVPRYDNAIRYVKSCNKFRENGLFASGFRRFFSSTIFHSFPPSTRMPNKITAIIAVIDLTMLSLDLFVIAGVWNSMAGILFLLRHFIPSFWLGRELCVSALAKEENPNIRLGKWLQISPKRNLYRFCAKFSSKHIASVITFRNK